MSRSTLLRISLILIAALAALAPAASTVQAHGSTTAGEYTVEIGFKNEPAIVGQPNGLELIVTNTQTGKLVSGLENTLQAEVIFGAARKTLKIEPEEGASGSYTAFLVPSRVGDYTWHITGKIEQTPVDLSMTSSPTTFASVEALEEYSFPAVAQPPASQGPLTLALAIIALAAGVAGILLGLIALLTARSKR